MDLDIDLLERSFKKIRQQEMAFMKAFYNNLFLAHPEFKPLFSEDMSMRRQKLLRAMTTVIEAIENQSLPWTPILSHLGQQHQERQVKRAFFPPFRQAMLETLAEFLGRDWTPEVAQVWANALTLIMDKMMVGYQ